MASELPKKKIVRRSLLDSAMWFFLTNKVVTAILLGFVILWGLRVAPFDWRFAWLDRDPVPVDAIPDIGENQQIVFTEWPGRSPQDVEDQITYPLTVSLLGLPGVKTVRSTSMFGFSSIYLIFEEDIEFYWSRSRILEKLNSLSSELLPEGVRPALGPDATGLGQVFWYTLEGRDRDGNPAGGWDLHELRTIQDWYVRYGLLAADGVSEVASVGGFVQEYQIDVDPDAMRAYGVSLNDVFMAVQRSNVDVGARTIEVNQVEYIIRGRGLIATLEDIENTVLRVSDGTPISIRDVGRVSLGPALRRGAIDKGGAEAVGGVVIVRHGANPLEAIENVKSKIAEIAAGLPAKALWDRSVFPSDAAVALAFEHDFQAFAGDNLDQEAWVAWLRKTDPSQWPEGMTLSQVTVVPFYDRTGLIYETLGTLSEALTNQFLITSLVILLMVFHLRSAVVISAMLPLSVLFCFIIMKYAGVDANIVALSGIAIAIGTIVDMSIIVTENVLRRHERAGDTPIVETVYKATREVGSAVITAVATTIVGFLPVFMMIGAEGKLFKPLAFTKTFALAASIILALFVVPALLHLLLATQGRGERFRRFALLLMALVGFALAIVGWGRGFAWWGIAIVVAASVLYVSSRLPERVRRIASWIPLVVSVVLLTWLLAATWVPLGPARGQWLNFLVVIAIVGTTLGAFQLFRLAYVPALRWFLDHRLVYLSAMTAFILFGACAWLGFDRVFSFTPELLRQSSIGRGLTARFPGMGKEFMPPLDEGSFLFMPSTMPHASLGEALDVLQHQDRALAAIPEIDTVVGKLGRVESALDPAPVNMFETVVNYKSEYIAEADGRPARFRFDRKSNEFLRDEHGALIPDSNGRPFRQWRDHIQSPNDIWAEMLNAASLPGTTSAPNLQPIAARLVMLQTGMRAPMGVKVRGPNLETIERVGIEIEQVLRAVPGVSASTVFADRIVGKPYLEINIDREAIARYGLGVRDVQDVIEVALGGRGITTTIEGRERYGVRVRYVRELRDNIESLGRIIVPTGEGAQIPLIQLANIQYVRGPESIKSEDTFLVGYVVFDKEPGYAEVDVVERCQALIESHIASGELEIPPGVSYTFTGNYENQVRSQKTLAFVLPLALAAIFLILYLQFRGVVTATIVFSSILIAWSGGFMFLWLAAQPGFLGFTFLGESVREMFQIRPFNLSVAVWVGFLALFGIASDDGVVMATYLEQRFAVRKPRDVASIRQATIEGAARRIRPCLMTSATTILALLPVLSSTGRGADIMVPMAIPTFGGMIAVLLSVFAVPVIYCAVKEWSLRLAATEEGEP